MWGGDLIPEPARFSLNMIMFPCLLVLNSHSGVIVMCMDFYRAYHDCILIAELEGIQKGDGYLFSVLDFICEIVPGTFHFYSIASLKAGLRPSLNSKVNIELKRIQTIITNR